MKKSKIAALLLAVIMVFALCACGKSSGLKLDKPVTYDVNTKDGFTMRITYLSNGGANLEIVNETGETIYSGVEADVSVQKLNKGKFCPVVPAEKVEYDQQAIMYNPGNSTFLVVDWTQAYGELPHGDYRLVKAFTNGTETFYAAEEFTLEDKNAPLAEGETAGDVVVIDGKEITIALPSEDEVNHDVDKQDSEPVVGTAESSASESTAKEAVKGTTPEAEPEAEPEATGENAVDENGTVQD